MKETGTFNELDILAGSNQPFTQSGPGSLQTPSLSSSVVRMRLILAGGDVSVILVEKKGVGLPPLLKFTVSPFAPKGY